MEGEDKKIPQDDPSFGLTEGILSPSKHPKTLSPLGMHTIQSGHAIQRLSGSPTTAGGPGQGQGPPSPFYPHISHSHSPLHTGTYESIMSSHPSPSSPYPSHQLPYGTSHPALYSPYASSHLAASGTMDIHSFNHHALAAIPVSSSEYRSFSAPIARHHAEASTSSTNTTSPTPSVDSGGCEPGGRPSQAGKAPAMSVSKGKHKGTPGAKARIPREAKMMIAEHIIAKGVAMANVDELSKSTGLTKQQIKSQLVDNRQNVRKQLLESLRSLQ